MPKYKVKIDNNKEFTIKDGFTYEDNLNETLDSAKVLFETEEDFDIQSFDDITIYDDSLVPTIADKNLLVDSGIDEIAYFEPTEAKTFELNLFSRTKWLERFTCPILTITKTVDKNVYSLIERYCNLFLPKVWVIDEEDNVTLSNKYKIATRVRNKFESITCPEFQWNEPTLREVLSDLMSTANCIPIINKDNEIDYLDLTLLGNPINTNKLERLRSSFTSSDYCSELTISLKNAIGRSKTRITEYTSLRSLSGEITTSNAVLKTQKPIYDIVKVTLCFPQDIVYDSSPTPSYIFMEKDITEYVVEKKVWDTLKTVNNWDGGSQSDILKATHLYYNRGNNTIEGWGITFTMRTFLSISMTKSIIEWILDIGQINHYSLWVQSHLDLRDLMIKLEYDTISEHSIHVGKYLPSRHYDNRIFDNQSNSYVDVQHQTIYEYAKVNRLGNKIKTAYAVYDKESEIPALGDYLSKNGQKLILFNRKIQYYDNQIVFEGQLLDNYVLKDYFTGIMAKKRSWAIAEGKEALDRKDIYKYFLEASFVNKSDNEANSVIGYSKLLSAFTDYAQGNSIKYVLARTIDEQLNCFPSETEAYSLELSKEVAGNSLIFAFTFGDNFSAGSYSQVVDSGAYLNNDYPYVNNFGEFAKFDLYFVSYINPSDGEFTWPPANPTYPWQQGDLFDDTVKNQMVAKGRIKNLISVLSGITPQFALHKDVYKDNREIISPNVQFELCSDTPNIIVRSSIWEYCSMYNDETHNKLSLNIYASEEETYDINDEYAKGVIKGNGYYIYLSNNQLIVTFSGAFKSWAICDTNRRILVAVNSTDVKQVYFNLLSTRDRNIYDENTRIPVDHMDN